MSVIHLVRGGFGGRSICGLQGAPPKGAKLTTWANRWHAGSSHIEKVTCANCLRFARKPAPPKEPPAP